MKKIYLVISSWSLNDIDNYDNYHDCYEVNLVTENYTLALHEFDKIVTDIKYQYDINDCKNYMKYIMNDNYLFIKDKKDNWFKCVLIEKEIIN